MKKVTVIILNYKLKKETLACVKSVKNSTYQNIKLIVVDNNSQDGLSSEIKKFPDITFIQNDQNLGYCGGNNIGIKKALENSADYIFVLNPDTEIASECISQCLKVMVENNAGILGPKILFADKKTIWYAGGILDMNNVLGSHRGVDEKDFGQYEKLAETDFVSGAAMFVDVKVFNKIGFFDERYFLYLEDVDFCFRAKKAGFKIFYAPKAIIYHENARSTGLGSPLQDYFITRNRMLFASKFLSFRTKFAIFREALKNLGNSTKQAAFFDFMTGNFGQGSFKI